MPTLSMQSPLDSLMQQKSGLRATAVAPAPLTRAPSSSWPAPGSGSGWGTGAPMTSNDSTQMMVPVQTEMPGAEPIPAVTEETGGKKKALLVFGVLGLVALVGGGGYFLLRKKPRKGRRG